MKKYPFISKPVIRILNFLGAELVEEPFNYDFDESLLKPAKKIRFLSGGWHSEKYFDTIKNLVFETYSFSVKDYDETLSLLLKEIKSLNSVSIHVRRGDYLKDINMNTYGCVCTIEYFTCAIEYISKLVKNTHFFIFSNDSLWVEQNFKYDNVTIVNCFKGIDSWKDMYLMSNCQHHIISNSTFSWWGAWLNKSNTKIVITPKFFINNIETKDLYPTQWIKLTDYN
jgi:hypothetical protein